MIEVETKKIDPEGFRKDKRKKQIRESGRKWRDKKYEAGLKPMTVFLHPELHSDVKEYVKKLIETY